MSTAILESVSSKKTTKREIPFPTWYKNFLTYNGGFKLKEANKFTKKVTDSKKEIRKILGGIRNIQKIETKQELKPIELNTASYSLGLLDTYLPEYLDKYDLKRRDLLVPVLEKFNNIKTTKHILRYAREVLPARSHDMNEVTYACNTLGNLYNSGSLTKGTYWVNITTSPRAFALLGHYGPDLGSCFAQVGQNRSHKYHLAQSKNSFVIVVSTAEQTDEGPARKSTVGRAWGFYNPKDKTFNVCNLYPLQNTNAIPYGNLQYVIQTAIKNILKADKIAISNNLISIEKHAIYLNATPKWTIYSEDKKVTDAQRLEVTRAEGA